MQLFVTQAVAEHRATGQRRLRAGAAGDERFQDPRLLQDQRRRRAEVLPQHVARHLYDGGVVILDCHRLSPIEILCIKPSGVERNGGAVLSVATCAISLRASKLACSWCRILPARRRRSATRLTTCQLDRA